jgi:hypothetical protein
LTGWIRFFPANERARGNSRTSLHPRSSSHVLESLLKSKERQRHPSGVLHVDEDIAVYPVVQNSFIGENLWFGLISMQQSRVYPLTRLRPKVKWSVRNTRIKTTRIALFNWAIPSDNGRTQTNVLRDGPGEVNLNMQPLKNYTKLSNSTLKVLHECCFTAAFFDRILVQAKLPNTIHLLLRSTRPDQAFFGVTNDNLTSGDIVKLDHQ